MIPEQIYINVHRTHMEGIILQQWDKGYLLIQTAHLTSDKFLLTFERSVIPQFEKDQKELKAVVKSESDIPQELINEALKK